MSTTIDLTAQPTQVEKTSRLRAFILIWFGQLVSGVGSGMTSFTLGVVIFQRTGSATKFALIFLFASLPAIIVLPLAGVLADRWDRVWAMILGNIGAGLAKLVIALMFYLDMLQVWQVYAAVMAVSAFGFILGISYTTLTTILVPRSQFGRVAGMTQTSQAAAQILPPAIGGALLSAVKVEGIILIDIATYVFAILTLLIVRIPKERPDEPAVPKPAESSAPPRRGPIWREAFTGWHYIKERPGLLALLIYFAIVNLIIGCATVLFTPMILSFSNAKVLGTILSISGVGFLCGSVVMSAWGGPKRRILGVLGFGGLFGVFCAIAGLRPSFAIIAAGTFGMFSLLPIINGCSQAIWQSKVPIAVQGRVFAVRRLIGASTIPTAALIAGPLADRVFEPLMSNRFLQRTIGHLVGMGQGRGIALMFVVSGLLVILTQFGGYFYPRIRHIEDELPDAPV
ncbi:MAG TPA: MFS transporter [Pyrinomonadaceae bacterium]|nr:MFS transporter [Pyrinomonadaceae bacterium]